MQKCTDFFDNSLLSIVPDVPLVIRNKPHNNQLCTDLSRLISAYPVVSHFLCFAWQTTPKALSPLPLGFLPHSPTFLTPFLFCHNGVLAIRHTNDCVSNPVISGTLTLRSTRGTVQISLDSAFLEVSVTMQLHRFTHEIINNLSVKKMFSALLATHSILLPRCFFIRYNNSLYSLSHSLFVHIF